MTRRKVHKWEPDYVIAPSETLREWMEYNGMSETVLAVACAGRTGRDSAVEAIRQVLERCPLSEAHAACLERGTGIPARFWLALEHNYRVGLAAGKEDISG